MAMDDSSESRGLRSDAMTPPVCISRRHRHNSSARQYDGQQAVRLRTPPIAGHHRPRLPRHLQRSELVVLSAKEVPLAATLHLLLLRSRRRRSSHGSRRDRLLLRRTARRFPRGRRSAGAARRGRKRGARSRRRHAAPRRRCCCRSLLLLLPRRRRPRRSRPSGPRPALSAAGPAPLRRAQRLWLVLRRPALTHRHRDRLRAGWRENTCGTQSRR